MTAPRLDPDTCLRYLERAAGTFTELLRTGDLAAPVPSCPGWSLTDLAHHLGGVHRWARTAIVEARSSDEADLAGPPPERTALAAWYREGADALLEALRTRGPDAECWSFGPEPKTAAFWFRRQVHETSMHVWDALASQGGTPEPAFDRALALDGVDEVCQFFFPRQVRLGRIPPLARSLAVAPDGTPDQWVLAGDGLAPATAAPAPANATVRGPAGALLLLLWNRTSLDDPRISVAGDAQAARHVLTAGIVP